MTNSFINMIQEGVVNQEPEVGKGATLLLWTDRHAYTIHKVFSPKKIGVIRDITTRIDNLGMTDSGQSYLCEENPDGVLEIFTLRKNGNWYKQGQSMKSNVLKIGYKDEYYDFSF